MRETHTYNQRQREKDLQTGRTRWIDRLRQIGTDTQRQNDRDKQTETYRQRIGKRDRESESLAIFACFVFTLRVCVCVRGSFLKI